MEGGGGSIRRLVQAFVPALTSFSEYLCGGESAAVAISNMQSIIDDQIAEARSMGMSAASVADVSDGELRSAKFQLLFGSAEKIQYDNHFYFLDVFLTRCSAFATKLSKCLTAIPNTSVRR